MDPLFIVVPLIAVARTLRPHVVLCDVGLPDISGSRRVLNLRCFLSLS